jgi:hypothetical protein
MALTNIDKEHLNKLITIPNLENLEKDKIVKSVQRNSNNYAKLKVLFKQMENIKKEIEEVINESIESQNLDSVKCNFKKIPGNSYFLYQEPEKELFFSILNPKEWKTKNIFMGEYYYDYDLSFNKI